MARRNLMRSWLTASLLAVSAGAGVLVAPTPSGAHHYDFTPDYRVKVYDDRFEPAIVYVKPMETVQFDLQPGASTEHTVTLEKGTCGDQPNRLCDLGFKDPDHPPVYRFRNYDEYPYYSRYAREQGNVNMRGRIVVTDTPPPNTVPPSTTTTAPPTTTTTTSPVTPTTAPPTTTTEPIPVRPMVIPDPGPPTTTTTAAPAGATGPAGGAAPKGGVPAGAAPARDKGKDKGKAKAAAAPTSTTAAPAPSDTLPTDVVFDPASLTPGFVTVPDGPATGSEDEAALDASAVVSLLNPEKGDDGGGRRLTLIVVGALLVLCLAGGGCAWYYRSSRYLPA